MGALQSTCGFEDEGCFLWKDRFRQAPLDQSLDELIVKLFRLQDLNGDGFLDEMELVQLNKKVAMLHYGKDVDKEQLKSKYQDIFRSMLDSTGGSVSFDAFRKHTLDGLRAKDSDKLAQSFILEQWISEAVSARYSFSIPSMQSISDVPFLLLSSFEVDPSQAYGDGPYCESNAVRTPPVAMSARDGPELADKPQAEFGSLPAPPDVIFEGCEHGLGPPPIGDVLVPRAPAPSEATSSGLSRLDAFSDGRGALQVTVRLQDPWVCPANVGADEEPLSLEACCQREQSEAQP